MYLKPPRWNGKPTLLGKVERGSCPEKFKAVSLRTLRDKADGASALQSRVIKGDWRIFWKPPKDVYGKIWMVAPVLLLNITSNTVSNVLLLSILHKPTSYNMMDLKSILLNMRLHQYEWERCVSVKRLINQGIIMGQLPHGCQIDTKLTTVSSQVAIKKQIRDLRRQGFPSCHV